MNNVLCEERPQCQNFQLSLGGSAPTDSPQAHPGPVALSWGGHVARPTNYLVGKEREQHRERHETRKKNHCTGTEGLRPKWARASRASRSQGSRAGLGGHVSTPRARQAPPGLFQRCPWQAAVTHGYMR